MQTSRGIIEQNIKDSIRRQELKIKELEDQIYCLDE